MTPRATRPPTGLAQIAQVSRTFYALNHSGGSRHDSDVSFSEIFYWSPSREVPPQPPSPAPGCSNRRWRSALAAGGNCCSRHRHRLATPTPQPVGGRAVDGVGGGRGRWRELLQPASLSVATGFPGTWAPQPSMAWAVVAGGGGNCGRQRRHRLATAFPVHLGATAVDGVGGGRRRWRELLQPASPSARIAKSDSAPATFMQAAVTAKGQRPTPSPPISRATR